MSTFLTLPVVLLLLATMYYHHTSCLVTQSTLLLKPCRSDTDLCATVLLEIDNSTINFDFGRNLIGASQMINHYQPSQAYQCLVVGTTPILLYPPVSWIIGYIYLAIILSPIIISLHPHDPTHSTLVSPSLRSA